MVASLSLGTAAFAQTMVGSQEVPEDQMAAVTEHCEMLAADGAGAMAEQPMDDGDVATDNPAAEDAPTGTVSDSDVDMDAITLADCQAAGLAE